jgi:hypothetical protein
VAVQLCGGLRQKILGHLVLNGSFCSDFQCDEVSSWSSDPFGAENGLFKGGGATLSFYYCACDELECICLDGNDQNIKLGGGKKSK